MKTIGLVLAAAFALMPWCAAPLFSQQNTGSSEKTITITRRSIDADGSETTETIIKKGKAAQNFDVNKYIAENKADNVDVEVRVEAGNDEERSVIVKRSAAQPGRSSIGFGQSDNVGEAGEIEGVEDVDDIDDVVVFDNDDRAFLGVEEDSDEESDEPGLVVEVVRGSAADRAGLRDNDIILQLNDTKTDRWSDLSRFIERSKPGDKVRINYSRNGKKATTETVLITRDQVKCEPAAPQGFLGVSPEDDDDSDAPGITVSITRNSAAEKAGLLDGDVITQLNDTPIKDFEDISDFMAYTSPDEKVRITYTRSGKTATAEAALGAEKSWDWNNWNVGNLNLNDLNINIQDKKACLGVYTGAATVNEVPGAKITGFTTTSAARDAAMECGDVIITVNGQRVQGHDDLWSEIAKYNVGEKVNVEYLRGGQTATLETTLKACNDQSRVDISDTDENGDNQSRRFFTWNWDKSDQKRLRENRVITIRKAAEGDAPQVNAAPENRSAPQDRSLQLEAFRTYPNPTQGQVTVEFKAEPVATMVTLYDMGGRQLFREELNAFGGEYNQQFDLSEYAKGSVIIHVQQGDKVFTDQVVVN